MRHYKSSFGDVVVNSPFVGAMSSYPFATPPLDANLFGVCESEMFFALSDSTYDDSVTALNDRGVDADMIPGDGTYTLQIFPTGSFSFGPGYQILRYSGYSPSQAPTYPGYDVPITFVPGHPILIHFETNLHEDGFIPKTNFVFQAVPPPPISNKQPHFIVGDCQTEFGGTSDWDPNDTTLLMNDQGIKGDRFSGDGIYTFRGRCDTAGSYQFKVLQDSGSWQPQFTSVGYVWDAGDSANLGITTTQDTQLVMIETDALTGRTKALRASTATSISDGSGFAGTPDIGVGLWVNNQDSLREMSIPLAYNTAYLNALTVELNQNVLMDWEFQDVAFNETQGWIRIVLRDIAPPNNWLSIGGRQIGTLHFSIEPTAEGQFLNIDTSTVFAPFIFYTNHGQPVFPEFSFGTISVYDTIPPSVPQLLSPEDGAIVEDATPTFVWGEVTLLSFIPNHAGTTSLLQSPVTYTLQYALDDSFTSSVVTIPGISDTTYTLPEYLSLSETTYYWHVEAVDLFGNHSGYQAQPYSFTVEIPTIVYGEDFNDCDISDWEIHTQDVSYFQTTTEEYVSPPCGLEMVSQSTGFAWGKTPILDLDTSKAYKLTFDFKVPNGNNHWFLVMDNRQVHLVIDYGRDLKAWQGDPGGALFLKTLATDQWYDIACKAYPSIQKYDIFVDDDSLGRADFLNPDASPYLRIGDIHAGFTDHGEGYWDDIYVYGDKLFIRGDANGDGTINVSDVVYLINYLFIAGSPAPDPLQAGDANSDGLVNVSDVVYLINYLFAGGPPPGCK